MPKLSKTKKLSYTKNELCDLVLDINSYSEFLPWCLASRINTKENNIILADLVIGFKMFREKFTSEVIFTYPEEINVKYVDGPFRYMNNYWKFISMDDSRETEVFFDIDFEFKSLVLEKLIGTVFNRAADKMIDAFELRAKEVYGKK
ncbi:MAG: ubiquinone-binding protein [Rhodospirillaceae bacterium]|nr:ubiquinone-binding protein [Rhodospirillaceae bacterium]